MKTTFLVSNFTAGEFSSRLYGRPDIAKYKNALKTCENFTVVPHGGARKRPGSKFVIEVKSSSDATHRLVPFQYNTEQTYMLLFGPSYVWFIRDHGIITHTTQNITAITKANPGVVTYSGSDTFANGDTVFISGVVGMHQVNNRRFTVANVNAGANTFELSGVDTSAYGTYSSGGAVGEIVELATTYLVGELFDLQFAQSADTLYITHPLHKPAKITRSSHTAWTLADTDLQKGPFRSINPTSSLILTPSSFSGAATGYGTQQVGRTFTLTATGGTPFTSGMVGALFRLNESADGETGISSATVGDSSKTLANNDTYTTDGKVYGVTNLTGAATWELFNRVPKHTSGRVRIYGGTGTGVFFDSDYLHSGMCVIRITGFTSSTIVTGEIVFNQMPASIVSGGTSFWEEGAFSTYRGFPRAVAFFEQRLMLAGTTGNPQTVYGSRTASFEDFQDGADDDDAIVFTVASGTVDVIRWLSGGRFLSCGTAAGEFAIGGTTNNEALTPTNVRVIPQTSYGSSTIQPIRVGQVVMFAQRSGDPDNDARKLREHAYQYESDAFQSSDLTVFSEHITGQGFTDLAYQVDPDSVVWLRRADGVLVGMTYERAQEVIAWHKHTLGGTSPNVNRIASVPGTSGDDLYLLVARTINGGTKRYVEVLSTGLRPEDDKEDGIYIDSAATYSGVATSTITGLWHLEGETVDVLNYGSVERDKVVTNGAITLTNSATLNQPVHVGLRYTSTLETLELEAGAQAGTAQSRVGRISEVFMRLYRSLGGTVGQDSTHQDDIIYRTPADVMGSSPPLFSGLKKIDFYGGFSDGTEGETSGRVVRTVHSDPLPYFVSGMVAEISTAG